MKLYHLLHEIGIHNPETVIDICEISQKTLKRWVRNDSIPEPYIKLLKRAAKTDCLWPGFRINGDDLIVPNGDLVHREQLLKWWIVRQKLKHYEQIVNASVQLLLF